MGNSDNSPAKNNIVLPKDSADLYRRSQYFTELFGDDVFFVTVNHASTDTTAAITGDQILSLSSQIAYNPNAPKALPHQETARAAFAEYRTANPDRFPTMTEVRNQTGSGEGVQLVSGGGFLFVTEAGQEVKLALFQRTGGAAKGLWTDANGLVSGPNTAQKESLEEYTPIEKFGEVVIVHALLFAASNLWESEVRASKISQGQVIAANLAKAGLPSSKILYRLSLPEYIVPVRQNTLTLIDSVGKIVDRLSGVVGFEQEYNTWIYRLFGLLKTDNALLLIDGEQFDRPGRLITKAELSALAKEQKLLSSTAAIGALLMDAWPQAMFSNNINARFAAPPAP